MNPGLTIQHPQKASVTITVITILLLLLWIPVTIDKLTGFASFKGSMLKQPLPAELKTFLSYAIPTSELFTTVLLVFKRSRRMGFHFSLALLMLFTGYVGLILIGVLKTVPCGCGAVVSGMSWPIHFLFNLSFLILNAYGIYLLKKQRSAYHQ